MVETIAAVLDENGMVVNTIVVDPDTVEEFSVSLIEDKTHPAREIQVLTEEEHASVSVRSKRRADGKFDPAPAIVQTGTEQSDVVEEVVSDNRLSTMTEQNRAVLEEVLTEKIGRPTPKPETTTPTP